MYAFGVLYLQSNTRCNTCPIHNDQYFPHEGDTVSLFIYLFSISADTRSGLLFQTPFVVQKCIRSSHLIAGRLGSYLNERASLLLMCRLCKGNLVVSERHRVSSVVTEPLRRKANV